MYCTKDNYTILIDDDFINKIDVKYDSKTKQLTVLNKSTKNEVFSVLPVLKAVYEKESFAGYSIILEDSGFYYLGKAGNDTEYKITVDRLKQNIKSC